MSGREVVTLGVLIENSEVWIGVFLAGMLGLTVVK